MMAYGSNRIPFALLDYSSKKNFRHMLSKNFKRCMKKHERHCVSSQIHSGRDYILCHHTLMTVKIYDDKNQSYSNHKI